MEGGSKTGKGPAGAGSGESAFWQSVAEATMPGWIVNYPRKNGGESPGLAGKDVRLYGIDCKSGRVYGVGFATSEAKEILERASRCKDVMKGAPSLAITLLRELAERPIDEKGDEGRMAMVAVLCALATTELFGAVQRQTGGIAGDYVYMIYSMRQGTPMARSAYRKGMEVGMLGIETLYQSAADVIKVDLKNKGGKVNQRITSSGGLVMCSVLDSLVNGA